MASWYEKCMPKIKDIKPNISEALSKFKKVEGVKTLYLWGSYAQNIDKPNFRVRDIDVLARTNFNSGDLIAVDDKIISSKYTDEQLENQGYDPLSIKFSKKFLDISKHNIDCWAISSDRKLLHWGPIFVNEKDSSDINKEAESYANQSSGKTRKKINKSSEEHRKNWFDHYVNYIDRCFKNMPTGWYQTEDLRIKDILKDTIKI